MNEILDLEVAWALVRKMYRKEKRGWGVYAAPTENNLINFLLKGPDAVIEIIQDRPTVLMGENADEYLARMPSSWRPVGKGAVLDEDPDKILASKRAEPYGLRQVSRMTFERYMRIMEMIYRGIERREVARAYSELIHRHIQRPVAGYNEIRTPVFSIGPITHRPSLEDISPANRELKAKLEFEVLKMQKKRMSYVS